MIEAPTPLDRTSRIKVDKNNARSRLFGRVAKGSIAHSALNFESGRCLAHVVYFSLPSFEDSYSSFSMLCSIILTYALCFFQEAPLLASCLNNCSPLV